VSTTAVSTPTVPSPSPAAFVTAVESNIKAEAVWNATLSPRTLILGPNASAKSAVLDAVRLATTGTVADLLGRITVADPSMLATLSDASEVMARATLADGRVAQCVVTRGRAGSVKKPVLTLPDAAVYPLDGVREALGGKPETTRRYLLGLVASDITDEHVEVAVGGAYLVDYQRCAKAACEGKDSGVVALGYVTDYAKKRAADLTKEGEAIEQHGRTVGQGLGPEPTDEEVAAARASWETAVAQNAVLDEQAKTKRTTSPTAQIDRAWERVSVFEAEAVEQMGRFDAATAAHAAKEAERAAVAKTTDVTDHAIATRRIGRLTALQTIAQWHREAKPPLDDCQLCGRTLPDGAEVRFAGLVEACDGAVAETRQAAMGGVKLSRLTAEVAEAAATVEKHRVAALVAVERYETAKAEAEKLAESVGNDSAGSDENGVAGGGGDGATIATPRVDTTRLSLAHDALRSSQMRHAEVRRAYTNAGQKRAEADVYDRLYKACRDAVKRLLLDGIARFEREVSGWLPPFDRFGVQLLDGEREVARIGLWRGGAVGDDGSAPPATTLPATTSPRLHTALSGGEWARVIAAIACVVAQRLAPKLCIVAFDDRSFDPVTLRAVLDGVGGVGDNRADAVPNLQVLIATTTCPDGVVVGDDGMVAADAIDGWTIVQTGPLPMQNSVVGADPLAATLDEAVTA